MAFWLFKNEPDCYSYADLERDGVATWDGVTNDLAQKHLRSIKPGDKVLFYLTGNVKAVVGTMTVSEGPALVDEKNVVVQVKPVKKFKSPVTLAEVKADAAFKDWDLVKNSRLSVMPVPAEIWKKITAMGQS
jgi:predicted RNA-binding protein with PUA-like domain